jgi:MoaA/NifB/PqqE/SkfB family radical SAM enzyme
MVIDGFHIEASSYCNARCPGCPRNVYGYNLKNFVDQKHLQVDRYREIRKYYQDIVYVRFNGGLGDPMMNPDIAELVDISDCFTRVTTNGSIGNRKTFEHLARKNVRLEFSIDGLEDTNHLYRQDVTWSKVMERVRWFIDAGGHAIWKWIPFLHNKHQLAEAKELSKTLGFKEFHSDEQNRNNFPALDKDGEVSHWILPDDGSQQPKEFDSKQIISDAKNKPVFLPETGKKFEIYRCEHLTGEVYITASGKVTPCCYHGTEIGNRNIVPVEKFESLKATWQTTNCDPTCAISCGRLLN